MKLHLMVERIYRRESFAAAEKFIYPWNPVTNEQPASPATGFTVPYIRNQSPPVKPISQLHIGQ